MMTEALQSRYNKINDRVTSDSGDWNKITGFIDSITDDILSSEIVRKIEIDPLSMGSGSVSIYLETLPENISLRLWQVEDKYIIAFFSKNNDYFDTQLRQTFNEEGIMFLSSLEEVKERLLDYVANAVYSKHHTRIIKPES